jgi:hypothetical protein
MHAFARAGEPAGVDDGNEAVEQIQVHGAVFPG